MTFDEGIRETTMKALTDRVRGTLYGVALGDAMGMPSELWPRERVLSHFTQITGFLPGPDGHFVVDGFKAGEVTDDTQQTLMLAAAIVEADGRVDPNIITKNLVRWADRVGASEGNFLGPSSARAIEALRNGASPWDTGKTGETNGAAMRISPVGIISPSHDLITLVDRVEAACVVSHHTDVAISGASLLAGAVSAAIDSDASTALETRIDGVLAVALEAARLGHRRGERMVAASVPARTELAVSIARRPRGDDEFLQALYDTVGASVLTTESVPAALGLFVRAKGDPLRASLLAANLGGDTDTIGAMATGLCGAFSGFSAIPAEYVDTLNQVNDFEIEQVADKLQEYRLG